MSEVPLYRPCWVRETSGHDFYQPPHELPAGGQRSLKNVRRPAKLLTSFGTHPSSHAPTIVEQNLVGWKWRIPYRHPGWMWVSLSLLAGGHQGYRPWFGCDQRAPGEGITTGDGDRLAAQHRRGRREPSASSVRRAPSLRQAWCPRLSDSILQSTISCSKRSWSTDKTTARDTLGFTAAGELVPRLGLDPLLPAFHFFSEPLLSSYRVPTTEGSRRGRNTSASSSPAGSPDIQAACPCTSRRRVAHDVCGGEVEGGEGLQSLEPVAQTQDAEE